MSGARPDPLRLPTPRGEPPPELQRSVGFVGEGPGVAVVDTYIVDGFCTYDTEQGEVPFPMPLDIGVISAGSDRCAVEGNGLCMYTVFPDLVIPPEVAERVAQRLGGA